MDVRSQAGDRPTGGVLPAHEEVGSFIGSVQALISGVEGPAGGKMYTAGQFILHIGRELYIKGKNPLT